MNLMYNQFLTRMLGLIILTALISSCCTKSNNASNILLIKNALLIPMEAKQDTCFYGYLLVNQKGNIQDIGSGMPSKNIKAEKTIDAKGYWVLPGFISAHSHLWQSAFTGIAPNENLEGWIAAIYGGEAQKLTAKDMYTLTYKGAKDHLKNGITTAFNFTFTGRDTTLAVDKAQLQAALDANIRVIHGFNVRKISNQWTPLQAEQRLLNFLNWTETIDNQNSNYFSTMIAGYSTYEDSTLLQALTESQLMQKFNVYNQQHYLESPLQTEIEQEHFKWLIESNMLNPKLILGHFIHTNPYITEMVAKNKVSMVWNPLSNGRLGSGTPDIVVYKSKNIQIGMGVDGAASSDRSDPFENMRMGLYSIRAMKQNASVLTPYEILRMHTTGSARVLNIHEYVGSLAKGKKADLIIIDPSSFTPYKKTIDALVLGASTKDIKNVFVGGVEVSK